MRVRKVVWLSLSVIALSALPAAAQDRKVGVTMGYPAAIGVLWPVSDKVAVRPEFNFTGSSGESSGTFDVESDSWAIGTGVSVLFYLKKYDRLQTYFTPRFTYGHSSNSSDFDGPVVNPETSASSNSYGFAGLFGAEQSIGDKFAVFGEVGFGLSRSTAKSNITSSRPTTRSWGTRAGVGVVFFP
jgi:hypothetical protein